METIKEKAQAYEPKTTPVISDVDVVPVDMPIYEDSGTDKKGKPFTYNTTVINEKEYRVPDSVLKDLKEILKEKPELKTFRVNKTGEGLSSKYTVIPLD